MSNVMARYSLELSEEDKQRIESCRKDLSWQELSFGAKLRVLVFERLAQYEAEAHPDKANHGG